MPSALLFVILFSSPLLPPFATRFPSVFVGVPLVDSCGFALQMIPPCGWIAFWRSYCGRSLNQSLAWKNRQVACQHLHRRSKYCRHYQLRHLLAIFAPCASCQQFSAWQVLSAHQSLQASSTASMTAWPGDVPLVYGPSVCLLRLCLLGIT